MTPVINWIKSNVVIVIFVALMIAAAIALPVLAGSLAAGVKADVDQRMQKESNLDAIKSVSVEQPGGTQTVSPNQDRQEKYAEYMAAKKADAVQLHEMALVHNRKDRSLLLPELFPQPPSREREVLPERFVSRLNEAYDSLLKQIRAGAPPTLDEIAEKLGVAESEFRIGTLKKGETEPLTAEESAQLQTELASARMNRAAQAAAQIGMYVTKEALDVPIWVQSRVHSLAQLFDWQWIYWIHQDILLGLNELNKEHPSVVRAPVKRVMYVRARALATASGEQRGPASGAAGPAGPSMGGPGGALPGRKARPGAGFGSASPSEGAEGSIEEPTGDESGEAPPVPAGRGAAGRPAPVESQPLVGPPAIDPSVEAQRDYRVSFTGRMTNQLYDVRYIDVGLVVETAAIPRVLEALSQRNFMTVLDVTVTSGSIFDAVRQGYYYGDAPVSELTIVLETVWLREWMAPFMPADLRALLNIKSNPAGAAG